MSHRSRFLLWPFSLIYRGAIFLWDIYWRVAPKVKLPCRIISVGNIIAGGTGKTPVVIYIANLASEAGIKTAVVAKGYKRVGKKLGELNKDTNWLDVGDEPLEVFQKTRNVRVYVADLKTAAARRAASDGAELIIIDDGFQHRKLHRDIDIVCLDQVEPFGPGGYLPMGLLRESPLALRRADIVIYTSCDNQDTEQHHFENMRLKIFRSSSLIRGFEHLKSKKYFSIDDLVSKNSIAFCGLGFPEKFKVSLGKINIKPLKFICFGDHHRYTQKDINMLKDDAIRFGADCLLTTHKDAVKIEGFDFGNIDIYSGILEIRISNVSELKVMLGL